MTILRTLLPNPTVTPSLKERDGILPLKPQPTVATLFSGWGGGSWGFKATGYKELCAIDNNRHSRLCFSLNFPGVPVLDWDINKMTSQELLDFMHIQKGELDVLFATPPCQGISQAGKFDPNDPRNKLFLKTIDLIGDGTIAPKCFLIENVSSIQHGRMKAFLKQVLSKLDQLSDYTYDTITLNSLWYNVPSSRKRYIILGVRKDLNKLPAFPVPDLVSAEHLRVCDVAPHIQFFTNGYKTSLKYKHNKGFMGTLTKTRNVWVCNDGILRNMTTEEILIFCGYPKGWKYVGSPNQIWARAGNSVMPLFAKALAETIKYDILGYERPSIINLAA